MHSYLYVNNSWGIPTCAHNPKLKAVYAHSYQKIWPSQKTKNLLAWTHTQASIWCLTLGSVTTCLRQWEGNHEEKCQVDPCTSL